MLRNPIATFDRYKALWDAVVKIVRDRRPWLYLAALGFALLIGLAAGNVLGQAAQDITFAVFRGVWWALQRPLWMGGVLLVAFAMTVLGVSWWETRPKLRRELLAIQAKLRAHQALIDIVESKPKELSVHELNQIQHIRTFWMEYGRSAPIMLCQMLETIRERLMRNDPLVELVDVQALRRQADEMDEAVANNSTESFTTVQARLTAVYGEYQRAAKWFVHLVRVKRAGTADLHQLKLWPDESTVFRVKLNELSRHPENAGCKWFPGSLLDEQIKRFLEGDVSVLQPPSSNQPDDRDRIVPPHMRPSAPAVPAAPTGPDHASKEPA